MKRVKLKSELWKRGIKQVHIARATGKSESLISRVLSGERQNEDVLNYINSLIKSQRAA